MAWCSTRIVSNRKVVKICLVLLCVLVLGLMQRTPHQVPHVQNPKFASIQRETYVRSKQSNFCQCNRQNYFISKQVKQTSFHWCSKDTTSRGPHQNIVAYSLYGKALKGNKTSRYFSALKLIPEQVKQFYPGWQVRVYHDIRKNESMEHQMLCKMYCTNDNVDLCDTNEMRSSWQVRENKTNEFSALYFQEYKQLNRMLWRNLPLLDDQVDKLMVRDIDAEINSRESAAVQQWLQSNYTFHVMRDHQYHCEERFKILGGMFDIKVHQRRDAIRSLAVLFLVRGSREEYGQDQKLLNEIFWPIVRLDAIIHDSYCCRRDRNSLPATPFPTKRENWTFVSDRVGANWPKPRKCPVKCRPPGHRDWEYC